MTFNYDFIKYESEKGFIFSNKKIINGIGASSNFFDKTDIYFNKIIRINFRLSKGNYDYYKRTYVKFQSFLADLMCLINALFSVCSLISELLLYKKLNKYITIYIRTQNEIKKII